MGAARSNKLRLVYGDGGLGVQRQDRRFLFSYTRGGLESLRIRGREWLCREPQPALWRALTDNDRGSGFQYRSGVWLAADLFLPCTAVEVTADGRPLGLPVAPLNNDASLPTEAETVTVAYSYETITTPAAHIRVTYTVEGAALRVAARYSGGKGLPELPVFGVRFVLPMLCQGYTYRGLSGETYPDRMAGGVPGVYQVEGLPVTPYLVPQDCGMHMDSHWLEVRAGDADLLRFEREERPFAFSCLPYTPQELENAAHQEELPAPRRTVVTVYGAVRGVGGIDSWRSLPEPSCRVSGEGELAFSFTVR